MPLSNPANVSFGNMAESLSAASSTTLTSLGRVSSDTITLATGAGAYVVNRSLSQSGPLAGDLWEINVSYPASTNPTINIYDGSTGGTLLSASTGTTIAGSTTLQFVFNGTNWIHYAKGAVLTKNLGTGLAAWLTTPSSANLASALTDETGSGPAVFATSPALTTPNLGTPTALTLTNATGLPISTGVSGLATGIATLLGTPSSANLAAAVTDETGSGALVFATSPTLVTPALGTPTSATLTNATGLPESGVVNLTTDLAAKASTVYSRFPATRDYVPAPLAWYRGTDLASLADGAAPTTWPDRSGNGYDATIAFDSGGTAALKQTGYDGRAVIRFIASGESLTTPSAPVQYMTFPSGVSVNGNTCTVFVVSTCQNGTYFTWSYTSNPNAATWNAGGTPNKVTFFAGNTKTGPTTISTDQAFNVQGFRGDSTGIRYFQNRAYSQLYCTGGAFNVTLTSWVFGKTAANNTGYMAGDVSEIIVFNSVLTDDQIQSVLGYLSPVAATGQTRQVVYDGDSLDRGSISLTDSFNVPFQKGYAPSWMAARILGDAEGTKFLNFAYPGTTITGTNSETSRASLVAGLYDGNQFPRGSIYLPGAGSNDVAGAVSPATIIANKTAVCAGARAAGFKAICRTILDRTDLTTTTRGNLVTVNNTLRATWQTFADAFVDLDTTVIGGTGISAFSNTAYYNADGIHLTKAGYEVKARAELAAINSISSQPVINAGNLTLNAITAPVTPTLATIGTAGSTTITYKIVHRQGPATTAGSATATITTANATLTSANAVTLTWTLPAGFIPTATDIYRLTAPGTSPTTTGYIGTVSGTTLTFNDRGQAGDGTTAPTIDTTGTVSAKTVVATHQLVSGTAPTIAAGAGAGTSPTVTISGNDGGGQISIASGTLPTVNAVIATISYGAGAFPNNSYPVIWPANANAATLGFLPYVSGSATNFTVSNGVSLGLTGSTTYLYNYQVLGN